MGTPAFDGLSPPYVAVVVRLFVPITVGLFGGMIAATFLGVFLIPLLYVVFQRLRSRRRTRG